MSDIDQAKGIRTILLQEWDHLIVWNNPHLSDEYDSYVDNIIILLKNSCSKQQLVDYQSYVELELMSLPQLSANIQQAA